ncbi:MAG: heme-binding protein [Bacteroidetes bacterium]|nr:heme-binding protein [Bacteroidota bacterium]
MKALLIIVGILAVGFLVIQLLAMRGQRNIEMYPYTTIKTYDDFEIRKYEASLFTSVKLPSNDYKTASGKGFSILAGYIFGGNDKKEKIAMTSPVAMTMEDSMTMMFMVPKKIKKENLPQPDQSQIEFREEPEKIVAAIRFSGWANNEKLEEYKAKLTSALDAEGISYTNKFYFLGYNPPYEMVNRRNEIIVELGPAVYNKI